MFDEKEALRYPLFADDFGDPSDVVLSDKIVTARSGHICVECLSPITVGARHRVHRGIYDGAVRMYRFCPDCCAAMAAVFNGQPDAMEARWAVRQQAVTVQAAMEGA